MPLLLLLLLPTLLHAQTSPAPPDLLGAWTDDYRSRHQITDSTWRHGGSLYHIQRWDTAGTYLIAHNDSANRSDGGLWTRIDWLRLEGMAPWEWGFCIATWNAPSADSAAAVTIARRDTPRTGCNGFPFSRMKRDQ
ncbi:MAG TPA: hypothetical protein PLL69_02645 [Gemmatimonadales bacterium]|nr:hypothetical protein [Gemmatimonadales bacterium]